jgi:threonine synthase
MMYESTRGNHPPVTASQAIGLGMVPQGGLFIPESYPVISAQSYTGGKSYHDIAQTVFTSLLTDYVSEEIHKCIDRAYNGSTFDVPSVVNLVELDPSRQIMELWHGPTAAFKDVALQIMPHLLSCAKRKTGNKMHTIILVATSGDTGKAALEGFKDADGISIVVFYPHEGVSEIQRLQMATTDGSNTAVVAVRGNFDDCQTGVKELFADPVLRLQMRGSGIEFSSANSINWGRLCPQIVYYFASYGTAVDREVIRQGEPVNFCVPTGNFGNILAGYYAKKMGLPVAKLVCASNKNRVLSDFFTSGTYDRNRAFFRTNSPSMDILISSNLERFLFDMCGRDAERVRKWYADLGEHGSFTVDDATRKAIDEIISAGWIDEKEVLATIRGVYNEKKYVLDTHTAVAVALSTSVVPNDCKTIIASTASPFKFSRDVLGAIDPESDAGNEFESIRLLSERSGCSIHGALRDLDKRPVLHERVIGVDQMRETVRDIIVSRTN